MKELATNKYFTQSGCLTLKALEKYSFGDMSEKEMSKIRSHIEVCDLCSDAVDGMQLFTNKENTNETIADLNLILNNKLLNKNQKDQSKKTTGRLFYYSTAASILILIGVLLYLNFSADKLSLVTADYNLNKNIELPIPLPPKFANKKQATHQKEVAIESEKPKSTPTLEKEKLKHITVTFSEIEDEGFLDEDLEVSIDEDENTIKKNPQSKSKDSFEGFLIDMVVISGINSKGGPSPSEQYLQIDKVDNHKKENEPEEMIFTIVETMPQFPNGEAGLRNYLQENLKFPAKARKAGIEGKVYVSFVVNSAGKVTESNVIKGIGNNCDNEALQVIRNMPFWKPATQQGRPVSVRFVIPVYFKLHIN